MNHSFNVEIATKLNSIEKAVLIENIAFWILKNKSNKKHFHKNNYWTYNSATAFSELFPYFKAGKIAKMLKSLEDEKIIKSDNFNKVAYDRTKWYTIIDKSICQIYKLHLSNLTNGIIKSDKPIPDIKPDIKKDIKKKTFSKPTLKEVEIYGIEKAREMNKKFNPLVFFNYYEANNWEGVKNWKQRLVNWLGREKATFKETKQTIISKGQDHLLDLGDL